MKFIGWVDCSGMMLCVNGLDNGFICEKYAGGTKVHNANIVCNSKEELEAFLYSLPNSKKKHIEDLMTKIESLNL